MKTSKIVSKCLSVALSVSMVLSLSAVSFAMPNDTSESDVTQWQEAEKYIEKEFEDLAQKQEAERKELENLGISEIDEEIYTGKSVDPFTNVEAEEQKTPSLRMFAMVAPASVPEGFIGIGSAQELNDIRKASDWQTKNYILTADINLGDLGSPWIPFPAFEGEFDGAGHTISNLSITHESQAVGIGLFSELKAGASVHNVTIRNVNIKASGSAKVGTLAGSNAGNINNCFVEKNVVEGKSQVGGLVGNNSGAIDFSAAGCAVQGQTEVGGLVGFNEGTITKSCATGAVAAKNEKADDIAKAGGFVGYMTNGTIKNCFSMGTPIAAAQSTGGFVGEIDNGNIRLSYTLSRAYGIEDAADRGAFVGKNNGAHFENCYFNRIMIALSGKGITNTDPQNTNTNSTTIVNPEGITENSTWDGVMRPAKDQSSYDGFDFSDIWEMDSDYALGYPVLKGMNAYGTCKENPIEISTIEDLEAIPTAAPFHYILMNDLNLKNDLWNPISIFCGNFDGNGNTISNLKVDRGSKSTGGLFSTMYFARIYDLAVDGVELEQEEQAADRDLGNVSVFGTISNSHANNLTVSDATIYGRASIGTMFSGISENSKVNNCNVINSNIHRIKISDGKPLDKISGSIGGFAGDIRSGSSVTNCTVESTKVLGGTELVGIDGHCNSVGGFVGFIGDKSTIKNCKVIDDKDSKDKAEVTGYTNVGGFNGYSYGLNGATITDCSSSANVAGYERVGGFSGSLQSDAGTAFDKTEVTTITNCSATGNVKSESVMSGGFVGINNGYAQYQGCYATGDVEGSGYWANFQQSIVGGFVGYLGGARMENCYATGDVTARKGVGGFAGVNASGARRGPGAMMEYGSGDKMIKVKAGELTGCYATGDVKSTDTYGISTAGGFIGYNGYGTAYPINCYATGDVSGFNNVGGFCGTFNSDGAINCYSTGKVTSITPDGAGGFAGLTWRYFQSAVQFINCAYDKEASGVNKAIAEIDPTVSKPSTVQWAYPVENYPLHNNARGLSTAEMQTAATFAKTNDKYNYAEYQGTNTPDGLKTYCTNLEFPWDFTNVWNIKEGSSRPFLTGLQAAQLLKFSTTSKNVAVGETATITLDDYVGIEKGTISWSIDGAGDWVAETGNTVTVKATGDGIIRVNAIVNGIKQDSIKLIAGTGGKEAVEAIFITPAPTKDGRAYSVEIRPELKIVFTKAINTKEFSELEKPITLIPMSGGVGAVNDYNLAYTFSSNSTILSMKLDKDLSHGVLYNLTLSDAIKSEMGLSFGGKNSIEFETYSFESPKVTLNQGDKTVTSLKGGEKYGLSAEFKNNIPNGDADQLTEDTNAKVFVVVRGGMGARTTYGGDILLSKELPLTIKTNETKAVSAEFELPSEIEGNVYVDVYTWNAEKSYAKALPVHLTYQVAE